MVGMLVKIIIAEKPKVARKIADAVSGGNFETLKYGNAVYYKFALDGEEYLVLPAVGHLYSLFPARSGWDYPIFEIEWRPRAERKGQEYSRAYLKLMEKFLPKASEVIIATDYDVEGSVIGHNIVSFINPVVKVKRMKFSSLTKEELKKAFEEAHEPNSFELGMYKAGITRHVLDWYWGINLSRALMQGVKKAGKFKVLSTGRVQGPTLKLVVERERQIRGFSEKFKYKITGFVNGIKFEGPEFEDVNKALEIFLNLGFEGVIEKIERKTVAVGPPAPFNLSDLQAEAARILGYDPKTTLDLAQMLYEAGLISYPRTSSQKLPKNLDAGKILKQCLRFLGIKAIELRRVPVEGKKDDPAHPAIYPTGIMPKKLDKKALRLYELIVRRFVAAFGKNALLLRRTVKVKCNNVIFKASESCIKEKGWIEVYPFFEVECKGLEKFEGKKALIFDYFDLDKVQRRPPRRYTQISLLKEMEKLGIGTKATRAEIVKILYDRGYVEGKSIIPTPLGEAVVEALERNAPEILDVELTRRFEEAMEEILFGRKNENEVIEEAKIKLKKILEKIKEKEEDIGKVLVGSIGAVFGGFCPYCNGYVELRVYKNQAVYKCRDCKRVWKVKGTNIKPLDKFCSKCSLRLLKIKKNGKTVTFCPEHGVLP